MNTTFKIGDLVSATVTKNGYFINSYRGKVIGFTNNGRVKVSSWRGVKIHAEHNLYKLQNH